MFSTAAQRVFAHTKQRSDCLINVFSLSLLFYLVDRGEQHFPVIVFIRQDVEIRRLNLRVELFSLVFSEHFQSDILSQLQIILFSVEHLLDYPSLAFQCAQSRYEVFLFSVDSCELLHRVFKEFKIQVQQEQRCLANHNKAHNVIERVT